MKTTNKKDLGQCYSVHKITKLNTHTIGHKYKHTFSGHETVSSQPILVILAWVTVTYYRTTQPLRMEWMREGGRERVLLR